MKQKEKSTDERHEEKIDRENVIAIANCGGLRNEKKLVQQCKAE